MPPKKCTFFTDIQIYANFHSFNYYFKAQNNLCWTWDATIRVLRCTAGIVWKRRRRIQCVRLIDENKGKHQTKWERKGAPIYCLYWDEGEALRARIHTNGRSTTMACIALCNFDTSWCNWRFYMQLTLWHIQKNEPMDNFAARYLDSIFAHFFQAISTWKYRNFQWNSIRLELFCLWIAFAHVQLR